MSSHDPTHNELIRLLSDLADGALTTESHTRLTELLRSSQEFRDYYARFMAIHVELLIKHQELSQLAQLLAVPAAPLPQPATRLPHSKFPFTRLLPIAALLAFVAVGILAYTFWPGPAAPPAVKQAPTNVPAAKIDKLTDAKWADANSPGGNTLVQGQRLVLQCGSVEITFNSQAKVMLEGPAEFVVVDAGACRLAAGKLTAHVPAPAKGFQVHTPSGTVTDLGTEFGVYVKTGPEERPTAGEMEQLATGGPQFDGTQPPVTEVHVFRGKVELAQAPPAKSQIGAPARAGHPNSQILSAGEAVTISDNKVQSLPAADPFKFALDKLQGKPRTVLLSDDFEAYPIGKVQNALGPWIMQGGMRKGQGVAIDNYDKLFTDHQAQHGLTDQSLLPLPPSISHVLTFIPSPPNPPQTFPRLARAIDAPQLTHTCQVLVEFVMIPVHPNPEPSLALATEAGPAPGIDFWRNADPAVPRAAWDVRRCYRFRILLDVVEGTLREARVTRSAWRGIEGWVRDADYRTPVPKVDWSTPPRFVIFGYPMVSPQTPPGVFSIDNIRMEVIAER